MIWIIDSKQMLKQVCKDKFEKHHHLIDLEARNQFHGATRSAIKYMSEFNYYGARCRLATRWLRMVNPS